MEIRLELLGGVRLLRDGAVVTGRAVQPRRLALLALIALSDRRRVGRQRLMAMLWPELDQASARRSLNEAVYVMRRELGDQVLVSEGDDVVLGSSVACDVTDFHAALSRTDKLAEAVRMYSGPFYGSTVPPDAPDFEQWVEREREVLGRRHRDALQRLAAEAEAGADFSGARHWYEGLLVADATSVIGACGLARCLAAQGNPGEAIRVIDAVVGRWSADLELPAPSELLAARAALSSAQTSNAVPGRTEEAQRHASPSTGFGPAPVVTHVQRTPYSWATRRRALLAFGALVGAGVLASQRPRKAPVAATAPIGVAMLLAPNSSLPTPWRPLLKQRLLNAAVLPTDGTGSSPRATAKLLDERTNEVWLGVTRPGLADTAFTVQCSDASRSECMDLVARQLLLSCLVGPRHEFSRRAISATASFPAAREYLLGERHAEREEWGRASDAWSRALSFDPLFAHAAYRRSHAADWVANEVVMMQMAREAIRMAEHPESRVNARDRVLFRANLGFRELRIDQTEQQLRQLVHERPDDVEAQYMLAEVRFHLSPLRGRSIVHAEAPLREVLRVVPSHMEALSHLARLAGRTGRLALLDTLVEAITEHGGEREVMLSQMYRNLVRGDSVAVLRAIGPATSRDYSQHLQVLIRGLLYGGSLTVISAVGDRVREHNAVLKYDELLQLQAIAFSLVAQGRIEDALHTLGGVNADRFLGTRAWIVAHPFYFQPQARLRAYRDSLGDWKTQRTAESDTLAASYALNALHEYSTPFLQGVLSHALGDRQGLQTAREALAEQPRWASRVGADSAVGAFGVALEGYARLLAGDTTAALRLFRTLPAPIPVYQRGLLSVFGRERALAAVMAANADKTSTATSEVLRALTEGFYTDVVFLPMGTRR